VKTKRLFVAIELPESTRKFLVDLDPKIRGARWLDAGQMHLTLGFFGDVPEDVDLTFREKLSVIEFGSFFCPSSAWEPFRRKAGQRYSGSVLALGIRIFFNCTNE